MKQKNEPKLLRPVASRNRRTVLQGKRGTERKLPHPKAACEQKAAEFLQQRESFEVILSSIGDAVITTDTKANVTFLNPVAEKMTGWSTPEALGQPLKRVVNLINELTGKPARLPVARALREGKAVGLANHTALVPKNGKQISIEDSAAPIRDSRGKISGAVMVFRDVTERRKAQLALRRSEQLLSDFFENAALGLHWVGPDGVILRANRTELQMLGYTKEEYIGHHLSEFHADPPAAEDILRKLASGDCLQNYEARLRCKDGSIKHALVSSNVLWEDGKFIHARCFTRDVTEQKLLQELNNRLAAVVESSDDAIVTKTLEGIITTWNKGAERIFGYTAEEVIDKPVSILIPPDRMNEEPAILDRLKRGEKIDHYETVRRRKDGKLLNISLTIFPIKDASGRIIGASKVARDITERKLAQEGSARLAAMVESSDDAIITKTLEGIITTWNKGAERIFGYTAEEVIGKPVSILIPADRMNEEPGILQRLKSGERIDHYETIRRHKDGKLLNISLTVSPIRDDAGRIIGASKIARDMTEQKRSTEALRAAQAELSRYAEHLEKEVSERTTALRQTIGELESFSYSISHDLRAPLRAMQSFSIILAQECAEQVGPQGQEYIRRITTAAERMDRLIQDVLNYSRIVRAELPLASVDVEKLLGDILESYPAFHPPTAHIDVQGPFPTVLGNEAVLTQCISNLLGNAVKFVDPGVIPHVRVWSELVRDGDRVRIFFKDNGVGIEQALHEKIFGIFERVNNRYEGTGIGLAIVKKGVERMGGRVGLESALGAGSTFWLELQVDQNAK